MVDWAICWNVPFSSWVFNLLWWFLFIQKTSLKLPFEYASCVSKQLCKNVGGLTVLSLFCIILNTGFVIWHKHAICSQDAKKLSLCVMYYSWAIECLKDICGPLLTEVIFWPVQLHLQIFCWIDFIIINNNKLRMSTYSIKFLNLSGMSIINTRWVKNHWLLLYYNKKWG